MYTARSVEQTDAVSPVVGVILMVAVTVILSAVVGTFVFNVGQSTGDPQESLGVRVSETDIGVDIQFVTSTQSTVHIKYHGETVRTLSSVSAGESVVIPAAPGEKVTIATNNSVITTHTVDRVPALAGYWPLDARTISGTTVADLSAHSHDGTMDSSVDAPVSGRFGDAARFDGTNEIETVSSPSLNMTQEVTITFWVYNASSTDANRQVVNKLGGGGGYRVIPSGDGLQFSYADGGTYNHIGLNLYANSSEWEFVAVTFNDGTITGYLNTQSASATGPDSRMATNTYPLHIVDTSTGLGADPFVGRVDDVRIYNRALSADEIAAIYHLGAAP